MNSIIIRPIITEESMKMVPFGKYSFAVAKHADKGAIRNAVKNLFNVNVVAIATSMVKGKKKRVGSKRQEIDQTIWKRAIIKVKKGEKIALFEPGGEEPKK
ncbi:MAG TPA: 50S ribosomal protein L23 [Patescibacteria group bacterium]